MLPEKGGAGYFTLLVCDRLTDFGRPVTLDELVDAVWDAPGLPWTYVDPVVSAAPCHGAYPSWWHDTSDGVVPPTGYDEATGWHHPSFDVNSRSDRRKALTYVVRKRLANQSRTHPRIRQWVIRHDDGRYERNPNGDHPSVASNGKRHDWSPETRAEAERQSAEEVRAISEQAAVRSFELATIEEQATMLRHLAGKLPASKSAAGRVASAGRLRDIDKVVGDDPERVLAFIHKVSGQSDSKQS